MIKKRPTKDSKQIKIQHQDNWYRNMIKKRPTAKLLNIADISSNEWNQTYLQLKSSIESSHKISKPKRNPNLNLDNLVIGFCHQSCAFWRIGLMTTSYYFYGTSKSGFAKREGKYGLLMYVPYSYHVFSLLFNTFFPSFFLSLRSFFTFSFLLLSCRGLFPLGSFFFLGPSLWVPPPLSASQVFTPLSYHGFFPSSMATSPLYNELI